MGQPLAYFEIPAQDLARLKSFYAELFGWRFDQSPHTADYLLIHPDEQHGGICGGLAKKMHPQQSVMNYVSVDSVADYADKVQKLGGKVVLSKTAVPKTGWFAVCLDPEGNPIGLWQEDANAQ